MKPLNEFLNEGDIHSDSDDFAKDLIAKNIAVDAISTSSNFGALGKKKIKLASNNKNYNDFKKEIEKHYNKIEDKTTSFSSNYYYSPKHKLYFFFYAEDGGKSYKGPKTGYAHYDYVILVKRKLPK
jgi:deoxyxylulose-5-phosphate synthase